MIKENEMIVPNNAELSSITSGLLHENLQRIVANYTEVNTYLPWQRSRKSCQLFAVDSCAALNFHEKKDPGPKTGEVLQSVKAYPTSKRTSVKWRSLQKPYCITRTSKPYCITRKLVQQCRLQISSLQYYKATCAQMQYANLYSTTKPPVYRCSQQNPTALQGHLHSNAACNSLQHYKATCIHMLSAKPYKDNCAQIQSALQSRLCSDICTVICLHRNHGIAKQTVVTRCRCFWQHQLHFQTICKYTASCSFSSPSHI